MYINQLNNINSLTLKVTEEISELLSEQPDEPLNIG